MSCGVRKERKMYIKYYYILLHDDNVKTCINSFKKDLVLVTVLITSQTYFPYVSNVYYYCRYSLLNCSVLSTYYENVAE